MDGFVGKGVAEGGRCAIECSGIGVADGGIAFRDVDFESDGKEWGRRGGEGEEGVNWGIDNAVLGLQKAGSNR